MYVCMYVFFYIYTYIHMQARATKHLYRAKHLYICIHVHKTDLHVHMYIRVKLSAEVAGSSPLLPLSPKLYQGPRTPKRREGSLGLGFWDLGFRGAPGLRILRFEVQGVGFQGWAG